MALEIERKFLVDAKKFAALNLTGGEKIVQGYLCTEPTVRVRTKGARAFITIKSANDGIVRHEYEYEIPVTDAEEMLKLCAPRTLEKTRYKVEYSGHIFEIDIFEGRHAGLILAEVELNSADETVELPEWIGAEVSSDPNYYNSRLVLT
ncbi:MAG: CYTH domain-containing protein [Selenomonadaceae bacterium]|nr:CYTH domain-containing protein [Selenomonadaceae bacterium]